MIQSPETPKQAALRLAASPIQDGFIFQALHEYTDAKGNIIYWRIRFKHPNFESLSPEKQKHYRGKDKWVRPMMLANGEYSLKEPKFLEGKPLYRLHQLAARPDDTVFITEGESCVDALSGHGLLATTSGAADSASAADWKPLQDRTVKIWPDNDDAGKSYCQSVIEHLLAFGCKVRVIDVSALGLQVKGDAVDWLAAHPDATGEDINQLPCTPIESIADTWPDPLPIDGELLPVQQFNADVLLPPILRDWVMDNANRMPCPPDYIAVAAIASLGSVIGARCVVKPKRFDDWAVVPNLWGGIVGLPSAKKSPAINAALKPLDYLIATAKKRYEAELAVYEKEQMIRDFRKEDMKNKLKNAVKNEEFTTKEKKNANKKTKK